MYITAESVWGSEVFGENSEAKSQRPSVKLELEHWQCVLYAPYSTDVRGPGMETRKQNTSVSGRIHTIAA